MDALETMLFKIKIKEVVDLKRRYLFKHMNAYFLGKNNTTLIIDYAWKKYSNAFILQKKNTSYNDTGTQNAL